jgi:hypothetical protein
MFIVVDLADAKSVILYKFITGESIWNSNTDMCVN